jgi:hypothetical protein
LYDYITELIGEKETCSIAQSWKLPKENYHKDRFMSVISNGECSWKFSDMGLLIFNDELGIFWYEVDVSNINNNDVFLDLAYSLKELSRGDNEKNYLIFNFQFDGEDDSRYKEVQNNEKVLIQEIKETKQGSIAVCKKKIGLYKDVLCKFIPFLEIDSFFSNRKKDSGKTLYPDRAIAFSWIYEILEREP